MLRFMLSLDWFKIGGKFLPVFHSVAILCWLPFRSLSVDLIAQQKFGIVVTILTEQRAL